jgi:pimeloyl-ACP methyl ester carboxylesterase
MELKVDGATLYYEVRGEGPVLLLICGGIYDAAGFADLAGQLAERYTVVTYDRRGNSRSRLDGPPAPLRMDEQVEDAHRLLAEVTDEPAYVFGNSSGADIALELAATHPEQVRTVVAHEPPIFDLLPDRERFAMIPEEMSAAYRSDGVQAAMAVFEARVDMARGAPPPGEPTPEMLEMFERFGRNMEVFVRDEVPPVSAYVPDVDALRASPVRVVLAAGEDSTGEPPHRAAVALAERLGSEPVLFPGGHGGFGLAEPFAATLHSALSSVDS